jgi:hypothetical protein
MWTSNDMQLCAYDAAEQFGRDCYPDAGRVYEFSGNERTRIWFFSIYGVPGFFTLTKSLDDSLWICNPSPSERLQP